MNRTEIMRPDYVKVTTTGKVRFALTSSMKHSLKVLLELFISDQLNRRKLDASTCADLVNFSLMNEIYTRHFAQLSLINGPAKLSLTISQAYAFWYMCQQYDQHAYGSAEIGGLLLQLHQKLS